MLLKEFITEAVASLRDLYPEEEARNIVLMLCEAVLGVQRYTHLIEPQTEVPASKEPVLAEAMERLRVAEPVQYVTGVDYCSYQLSASESYNFPKILYF